MRRKEIFVDAKELARLITVWISENAERESIFLTPAPAWEINAVSLLDYIVSTGAATEEEIGVWSDAVADQREAAVV
jgi:hypothetical protein